MTSQVNGRCAPRQIDIIADTELRELPVPARLSRAPKSEIALRSSTKRKNEIALRSSTDAQNKIALRLSTEARITRIESRRVRMKISIRDLCRAAGIRIETYDDARLRRYATRPNTVRKLDAALNSLAPGHTLEARKTLCAVSLNAIMLSLSLMMGLDPKVVLAQDFSSECSNDPDWRMNSKIRRMAMHILTEGIRAVGKAEISHALGTITRQGVHKAITTAERELMYDEESDAVMQNIVQLLKGEK